MYQRGGWARSEKDQGKFVVVGVVVSDSSSLYVMVVMVISHGGRDSQDNHSSLLAVVTSLIGSLRGCLHDNYGSCCGRGIYGIHSHGSHSSPPVSRGIQAIIWYSWSCSSQGSNGGLWYCI